MWKNSVESGSPHMTIQRMRIACWIPKAINTLIICNTYCLSTARIVARAYLYEACLSYNGLKYKIKRSNVHVLED